MKSGYNNGYNVSDIIIISLIQTIPINTALTKDFRHPLKVLWAMGA